MHAIGRLLQLVYLFRRFNFSPLFSYAITFTTLNPSFVPCLEGGTIANIKISNFARLLFFHKYVFFYSRKEITMNCAFGYICIINSSLFVK